jgi:beta-lactamase regulating signal transducer with metallopeptidase domain
VTLWFASNMVWASAAMLLVLALRRPAAHLFGAGPAYALWLLPALRLVMPPLPSPWPRIAAVAPPDTLVIWAGDMCDALPALSGGSAAAWLVALWAFGAGAFALWQVFAYRRFSIDLGRDARRLADHEGLALFESPAVRGPIAIGFIHRRIVVPADFADRYSPGERRLALDHEHVHHRRGDLWWNLGALVMLAANWFNPIAWLGFRAFREDQELACDAAVTARALPAERQDYARAMVKSATRPGLIAACPLNHAEQLKRRLNMLKSHRRSPARLFAGAFVLALLGGLGLTVGGAGLAQQASAPTPDDSDSSAPSETRRERRIVIHAEEGGEQVVRQHGEDGEVRRERVIVRTDRRDDAGGADRSEHGAEAMHRHHELVLSGCEDGQRDEVNEGTEGDRTRIILCSRGNATPAERAERLRHVRDRLAHDDEFSVEQRARVTAAIDREIARLRAQ